MDYRAGRHNRFLVSDDHVLTALVLAAKLAVLGLQFCQTFGPPEVHVVGIIPILPELGVSSRERKLLKAHDRQRTDSTHVLAAIRALNRLQCVDETMPGTRLRVMLNVLAVAAPAMLQGRSEAAWVTRYDRRLDDARVPEGKAARQALAETIGRDGRRLLTAIDAPVTPVWVREDPRRPDPALCLHPAVARRGWHAPLAH